jgi:hypothetical protein
VHSTDITAFWGARLRMFTQARLERLKLPQPTSTFLRDVGLPLGGELLWSFQFDVPQAELPECPSRVGHVVLGMDGASYVCVRREDDAVVIVDGEETVYVNRSVERFVEFLTRYAQYMDAPDQLDVVREGRSSDGTDVLDVVSDDAVDSKLYKDMCKAMRRSDATAFASRHNLWPQFLAP